MIRWILALALGVAAAWLAYGRAAAPAAPASRLPSLALALLRGTAVAIVAALLVGAPSAPPRPAVPIVAVDASASWLRGAGDDSAATTTLRAAVRRLADSVGGGDVLLSGDSLREIGTGDVGTFVPTDVSSRLRPAIDRAAAAGRPLIIVTDGEVEDADALLEAPPGSSVRVPRETPRPDAAVAELALPAAATAGDTLEVAVLVTAGAAGAPDGSVALLLDGVEARTSPLPALGAYASTRVSMPLVVPRGARTSLVRAVVRGAGDVEARNDTVSAPLEIGDRPPAVFVSTAPDLDVREALTVLRGALSLPTRAYLRLAPGVWREEGSLAAVSEADVRARAGSAGLLVLHGDTSFVPRGAGRSARALWSPAPPTPAARAGETVRAAEWYVGAAPPSPLAAALAGLPWDTLPPVTLAGPARGTPVLTARLGRAGAPAAAVAARTEAGTRTLVISGSGYAGWALRGGRSGEAFTALWGAMFDWLAAARGDLRAARPVPASVRAGERITWRRGGADSVVTATLLRRGAPVAGDSTLGVRMDSLQLRFSGADDVLSPPLEAGVYDVRVPGGSAVLVVNAGREWVPRAPTVAAGPLVRGQLRTDAPRLADATWPFVLALLLLCGEWIGRRTAGLR